MVQSRYFLIFFNCTPKTCEDIDDNREVLSVNSKNAII
ncbi:hypothetical protein BFV94_1666 [Alteromonas macleodii]|uniref:Uncharacterized protein n=1 Tax=Alteromonas macleodii TaxID=28108 RepID=A0AB36FY99_ALTMA|nr:hypothetical protein BFV95_1665 [Alteromonas macleodii]OES34923.1 hypothetical protein BFV94_1666 [Alteromonas macleodii]OES36911.1 hypothetical protein BFV93_1662 [Alteromonas macleodii]OES41966.1 hypothetical protein BFV96_1665 [Alteromonas macleodii]